MRKGERTRIELKKERGRHGLPLGLTRSKLERRNINRGGFLGPASEKVIREFGTRDKRGWINLTREARVRKLE